jgi:hypothetical protein
MKNVTILEIVSDYTGFYREVKFTGEIIHKKWLGLKRDIKTHSYVAFGNVGNWILVNVDGHPVKVPVHANSFIQPFLDSEVLNMEYRKTFKVDANALEQPTRMDGSNRLNVNCV